jgi:hypothetical protein
MNSQLTKLPTDFGSLITPVPFIIAHDYQFRQSIIQ